MALSRDGIARARSGADEIKSVAAELSSASSALKELLDTNGNYRYFTIGTDLGGSVNWQLEATLRTINESFVGQCLNISGTINQFCNQQEELNRQEELRRQQHLENSANSSFNRLGDFSPNRDVIN